ncbi:mediator of RNA polymerase II transcription subunit 20a-like [Asparagus officinalis]|uniref:mediator of RNA polymerase II transcription subunit 20a-like n=1 Tax=Asparagus officinalis TaxID=4686 RepID=UPI00098E3007|nr:mediator of RNA polymerase II transcription subunit 20a-like [Asparagus officinalis]
MTVKCPGTALNSQILTEACQCVEGLNGVKDGRWKSSLTFYRPIVRDTSSGTVDHPRDFLGLALQEQPNKYYFILRAHRIVLEADLSIQVIMEKLQSYKARIVLNFEGFQYQLGDFRLRVGKCVPSTSESLRGIMMEVEYLPLSSIEKSRQVLEEFFDIWQEAVSKKSLPGHFMHIESNFADYGLQDHYTSQHTAVQYATCMAQLIAAVRN